MSLLNDSINQLSEKLIDAWDDDSVLGEDANVSPFHGRVRFEAGVEYDDEVIIRHDFGMEAMEPTHREILSIADSALRTLRLRSGARLVRIEEREDSKRTIVFIFSS